MTQHFESIHERKGRSRKKNTVSIASVLFVFVMCALLVGFGESTIHHVLKKLPKKIPKNQPKTMPKKKNGKEQEGRKWRDGCLPSKSLILEIPVHHVK